MLPFYVPETTPLTNQPMLKYAGDEDFITHQSAQKAVVALVESQMANIKLHSSWATSIHPNWRCQSR